MRIDWWTLGLQTFNLLVLVWILGRFLFKPVAGAIAERQAATDALLDNAKSALDSAKAEQEKATKAQAETAKARADVLASANQLAEQNKVALLATVQTEVEKLRTDARAEIALMREKNNSDMGEQATQLAIAMTEKLFARLPEPARITGFVEGIKSGLGALPKSALAELAHSKAPLIVKAARALSASEKKQCQLVLSSVIGHAVKVQWVVAPELIAGLALETPHAVVRNNFRADLDAIANELTSHDPSET